MSLESVHNRDQAINVLQGFAQQNMENLTEQRLKQPLIKSYMLETVPDERRQNLETIFFDAGQDLIALDKSLYKVVDRKLSKTVGLLETIDELHRFPVLYTNEDSRFSDRWANNIVNSSSNLDHLWISGLTFEEMLYRIIKEKPAHRHSRLVFQYTPIFEVSSEVFDQSEEEGSQDIHISRDRYNDEDNDFVEQHYGARVAIGEKLGEIQKIFNKLKEAYAPFKSFSQLRFPAAGRGGHDLYHDGKLTNRSNDFPDHRTHVEYVIRFYKKITEKIEQTLWHGVERTTLAKDKFGDYLVGAPAVLEFSEPLKQEVFNNFVNINFHQSRNRFGLWGNPIGMGPSKVHVHALDRHLWQPIFLEITTNKIVAMIPQGTCGNTIHRLITNVQQYLDPKVKVYIGNSKYEDLILGEY